MLGGAVELVEQRAHDGHGPSGAEQRVAVGGAGAVVAGSRGNIML